MQRARNTNAVHLEASEQWIYCSGRQQRYSSVAALIMGCGRFCKHDYGSHCISLCSCCCIRLHECVSARRKSCCRRWNHRDTFGVEISNVRTFLLQETFQRIFSSRSQVDGRTKANNEWRPLPWQNSLLSQRNMKNSTKHDMNCKWLTDLTNLVLTVQPI